jgi:hypothetical protein
VPEPVVPADLSALSGTSSCIIADWLIPGTFSTIQAEKRAGMAFREAVEEGISEHVRLKLPIYVSRSGGVVEISPEEILNLLTSEGDPENT